MRSQYLISACSIALMATACTGDDGGTTSPTSSVLADFSADVTEGLAPLTVTFTDNSSASNISEWSWQFGDGGSSDEQDPSHEYTEVGTYTVSLEIQADGGSDQQVKVAYIVINDALTPTPLAPTPTVQQPTPSAAAEEPKADFSADEREGYAPLTVVFEDDSDDGGSSIDSWAWTFGDGGTSSEQEPTYIYEEPGVYTVTLMVQNAIGEDSKDREAYITVFQQPDIPVPEDGAVVINELLARSSDGNRWVELHNTTAEDIDLSGWLLSDTADELAKYTFPEGSTLSASGYFLLAEADTFGNEQSSDTAIPFQLSELGGDLVIASAQGGEPTGYLESEDYSASNEDVSFGRYEKSTGTFNFVAMASTTPETENVEPLVGPIVINEIYYNPIDGSELEFVELYNNSNDVVDLGSGWLFTDGIEFTFESGTTLAAGEYLIIAKDPDTLQGTYENLSQTTTILGPYDGKLSNSGETLQIASPGPTDEEGVVQPVRVDRVNYDVENPWPTEPDGGGTSLSRLTTDGYGNDAINWTSAPPSPGL